MSTYYRVSWKTQRRFFDFYCVLGMSVAQAADESLMLHFTLKKLTYWEAQL